MEAFMQLNLHQTHHEIGDFEAIFKYLTTTFQGTSQKGLHLFPELFLTGYPLKDLVLQKTFIDDYHAFLADLSIWSERQFKSSNSKCALLVGGLSYQFDSLGYPSQIENVIYLLEPGKKIKAIYTKQLLPNYDLYEEKKYFTPGSVPVTFIFEEKVIGLLVCEDMWFSHLHEIDPVEQLKDHLDGSHLKCDLVINLSASPYHLGKLDSRVNRALEISQYLKAPFAYINRVAAEDEIVFDGRSFVVDGSVIVAMANGFKSDILTLQLPDFTPPKKELSRKLNVSANSWGTIFSTRLTSDTIKLLPLKDFECAEVLEAIILAISDYSQKNNITKFTIALSGGMDSSLVLAILKLLKDREYFQAHLVMI